MSAEGQFPESSLVDEDAFFGAVFMRRILLSGLPPVEDRARFARLFGEPAEQFMALVGTENTAQLLAACDALAALNQQMETYFLALMLEYATPMDDSASSMVRSKRLQELMVLVDVQTMRVFGRLQTLMTAPVRRSASPGKTTIKRLGRNGL